MTSSIIQQNSPGGVASIRVVGGGDANLIGEVLQQVSSLIDLLPLAHTDREEMREDIKTAEYQLKTKRPKAGILSICLNSLLSKLATVVVDPLTAELAAGVQSVIDRITSVLGSL